jgi:hypothetical protein
MTYTSSTWVPMALRPCLTVVVKGVALTVRRREGGFATVRAPTTTITRAKLRPKEQARQTGGGTRPGGPRSSAHRDIRRRRVSVIADVDFGDHRCRFQRSRTAVLGALRRSVDILRSHQTARRAGPWCSDRSTSARRPSGSARSFSTQATPRKCWIGCGHKTILKRRRRIERAC